ncbi:MAG TPA: DUF4124 domain-containing protein [Rubrivivax sp.]|nr:DUF4124 domain-containing protein [Rubrivivax sp.]
MLRHFKLIRRLAGPSLAALACLMLSAPADAQWKWRDGRGQIHVSDIPPPREVPDKDVLQRPEAARKAAPPTAAPSAPAAAATPVAVRPAADPELEERKRMAEQEQAAQKKAEDKKAQAARADNCQRAREQLATLDSGVRVMRVRPDGEREYLSDEQRASETQRARSVIASECR